MFAQLKIIQLVIWIQVFKCWSRYVMFDFDLSSEILGSSQEVCSFASWLNSRPACCKPTGCPSWLPLVPSFASALGQEKMDFAAGGQAIKICQNYSGASSFRLFGSQLVSISLHWSCELRGSFSYRCYKNHEARGKKRDDPKLWQHVSHMLLARFQFAQGFLRDAHTGPIH